MWMHDCSKQAYGGWNNYFSFLRRCSFLAYSHLKSSPRSVLLNSVGIGIGVAMLISLAALTESSQQSLITTLGDAKLNVIQITVNISGEDSPRLTTRQLHKIASPSLPVTNVQMVRYSQMSIHEYGRHGTSTLLVVPHRLLEAAKNPTASRIPSGCVLYGPGTQPSSIPHRVSLNKVSCQTTTDPLPDSIKKLAPSSMVDYWVISDDQLPYELQEGNWISLYTIAFDSFDLDVIDKVREKISGEMRTIYSGESISIQWAGENLLSSRAYIREIQKIGLALSLVVFLVTGVAMSNTMFALLKTRTKEFGIRVACGAGKADIAMQCLLEVLGICMVGALSGSLLAALILFAVHLDSGIRIYLPMGYLVATYTIALVFGVAISVPSAIRASQLDPATAIRQL